MKKKATALILTATMVSAAMTPVMVSAKDTDTKELSFAFCTNTLNNS